MPEVSVVVATYNGARYLRPQLDSLLAQSVVPDEIVVCDDCSSDATWDILQEYASRYPQFRIFRLERNMGFNRNFESALSQASGQYIFICDQDDIWHPEKIRILRDVLRNIPRDVPGCASAEYRTLLPDEESGPWWPVTVDPTAFSSCYWHTVFGLSNNQGCSLAINRVLKESLCRVPFPEGMLYDQWVAWTAALTGVKVNTGLSLMLYRIHPSQAIGSPVTDRKLIHRIARQLRWRAGIAPFRRRLLAELLAANGEGKDGVIKRLHRFYASPFFRLRLGILSFRELPLSLRISLLLGRKAL